jgi:hypothetical protein
MWPCCVAKRRIERRSSACGTTSSRGSSTSPAAWALGTKGEAFGDDFELPNRTAYAETCASVANVYWNQRMFLLSGGAQYVDVMERSLYNATLAGVSLDGDTFFYPNPLESDGKYAFNHGAPVRKPWFDSSSRWTCRCPFAGCSPTTA